jgi:hypothetical protein
MSELFPTSPDLNPGDLSVGNTEVSDDGPGSAPAQTGEPNRLSEVMSDPQETQAAQPLASRQVEVSEGVAARKAVRPRGSGEYMSLASTIDSLFRQMPEQGSESPELRENCLSLLSQARRMFESEEFALAGYDRQQAEARLLRARLMEWPDGGTNVLAVARRVPVAILHSIGRAFSTTENSDQVSW